MNLYYAVTNYHLLCCILHAIKYHKKENNVLYLSNWHPDHESLLRQLKKINIFNRIELFKEVVFPSGNKKISDKQMMIDIQKILDDIPSNFISDVKKSNEINIAGDHYCASVYLQQNKITYNYLEEACGVLSDEERLMKIIRNIDYSRYQIMKKLGFPGNHSYIKNRYGDLENQLDGYKNDKDIHFSVSDILNTLSKSQIYGIVKVFSEEEFKIPNNSTLLLTFHYVNMKLLSLDEQRYLYYILVDYFLKNNKLVIKQHPSDIQADYHEWFPKGVILPRKMPSELLPFLNENKFARALTSYSTSIFSLKSYCSDVISFGMYIEKNFKSMHKYYFLLKILKECSNNYQLVGVGLDKYIIQNICYQDNINNLSFCFVDNIFDKKLKSKSIIIVDNYNLDDNIYNIINSDNIIFFLNDDRTLDFLKKHSHIEMNSVLLKKEIIDDSKYKLSNELYDEIIPYYCCDKNFISSVSQLKIKKTLTNCNINIEMETNSINNFFQMQSKQKMLYNEKLILKDKICKNKKKINDLEIECNKKSKELNISIEQNILKNDELMQEIQYYKNLYNEVINSSSWKITIIYRKIGAILKKFIKKRR